MARLVGAASSDRLTATLSAGYDSGPWSIFCWCRYDGTGGGNFGRIMHLGVDSSSTNGQGAAENAGSLGAKQTFATTNMEFGASGFDTGNWRFIVWNYDGTSQPPDDDGGTSNDQCAEFIGNASTSMAQVDTAIIATNNGSGSRVTGQTDLWFGNRPSLNRNWNGGIFCIGMVPYMMTIEMAEELRQGNMYVLLDEATPIFVFGLEGTDLVSAEQFDAGYGPDLTLSNTGTSDIADPQTLTWDAPAENPEPSTIAVLTTVNTPTKVVTAIPSVVAVTTTVSVPYPYSMTPKRGLRQRPLRTVGHSAYLS